MNVSLVEFIYIYIVFIKDVSLVEFMYLVFTLYLVFSAACQVEFSQATRVSDAVCVPVQCVTSIVRAQLLPIVC